MRPMPNIKLILIFCFLPLHVALPQEKPVDAELERLKRATDRCVAALSNEKFTNVFQGLLREYWHKDDAAVSQALVLESQYDALRAQHELEAGKLIPGAYELLGTRHLGKSLTRFVYFQKYEHTALAIGFDCYKAQDRWRLTGVMLGGNPKDDQSALAWTGPTQPPDAEVQRLKQATDRCVAAMSSDKFTNSFQELFKDYWYKQEEAAAKASLLESHCNRVRRTLLAQGEKIIPGA